MSIFGGRSFFGMGTGKRKPGNKRKVFVIGGQVALTVQDAEINVAATESLPGELTRRKLESATENVAWMRRGLFKVGFNTGAPRLRSARKFTK